MLRIGGRTFRRLLKARHSQARNNSYNKYSGNYGPRVGGGGQQAKRGLSLDRNRSRAGQAGQGYGGGYGQSPGLVRAQSQVGWQ